VRFLLPTATSADERVRAARTGVLPVGSFEQHGEYLPLITDTVVACLVAARVAEDYPVLLLPPITVSCSHEHAGFAGTVSISARTLMAVVEDVDESLRSAGVENLVIVNGHGGNFFPRPKLSRSSQVLVVGCERHHGHVCCVGGLPSGESGLGGKAGDSGLVDAGCGA
jgi:creatinine amidohydrolase